MFSNKIISSVIFQHMKKFQYFLLLLLFALPLKSLAQPFVEFTAQSTTVDCATNTLSIDIDVTDFTQMNAFDFSFHWDPTVLTFNSINDPGLIPNIVIGQGGTNTGILTFSWFSQDIAGTSIAGGTGTIVTINFDLIGNASQSTNFTFEDSPTFINIAQYGMALNSSQYTLNTGSLSITDTTSPTISCPSSPLNFDTGGAMTTQITGASPNANDNCTIDFISYDLTGATTGVGTGDVSNNIEFEIGTTTVTYTVNDFGGNTETCSFDVVVTNTPAPTMMTISMDNNLQVDCGTNPVIFNVYADLFNNIRSGQFTISWPASALEYVDTANYAINVGTTAFGTTNILNGELVYSWSHDSEISLPNGTVLFSIIFNVNSQAGINIPVTFVPGSDEFTNDASTTFPFLPIDPSTYSMVNGSLISFDNVDPSLTCPANTTVVSTNGMNAVVNGISPITSDNCGIMDTTYMLTDAATSNPIGSGTGDASGTTFPVGTTIVEYTVADFGGNQVTCNFEVTVQDPGAITVTVDSIEVDCETGTVNIGFPVENFFDVIGVQFTIEWDETKLEFVSIVEDNFDPDGTAGVGQVANGSFNFSWFDINNPTSFLNGNEIIVLQFNILDQTPGNSYDINFVNTPTPYAVITQSSFPGNDLTALSEPGNVLITDNTAPMITCPADVTVNSNGAPSVVVNNIGATATDNCSTPSISYVIAGTPPINGNGDASGNTFPVGTTMVTYTATDESGNSTSCNFNVTVIQETLMIDCPADINQGTDANVCSATLDLPITILSNINDVNTIAWSITGASGPATGTGNISSFTFSLGNSVIEYTVTDNFGAIETCSFNVTINDTEAPVISNVPTDVTVECDNIPTLPSLTANDQCDGVVAVTLSNETTVAGPTPGSTIITRSWVATDAAGNSSTASQTITTLDTTAPSITCPADMTVSSSANPGCGENVSWTVPTASDNCDMDVQVASSFTPGDFFPLGTTEITYFAIDDAGNIDSCKFNITVNDTTAPALTDCPTDITVSVGNNCLAQVTWDLPMVSDNCDSNPTVVSNPPSGFNFSAGTFPIEITATDSSGNMSTCNFNVIVIDTVPPSVFCPANVTVSTSGDITIDPNNFITNITPVGCDSAIITFDLPLGSDNCGNPSVAQITGLPSGSTFGVGQHVVQFQATDDSGNVNDVICETTITLTSFVGLTVTATPDTVCTGDDSQLLAQPFVPVAGGIYSWTGPNPNRTIPDIANPLIDNITIEDAGTYIVTVTDPVSNCTSIDSVSIVVSQGPELSISVNSINCIDPNVSSNIPIAVQITNGVTVDSFIWTDPNGNVFSNDQNAIIVDPSEIDEGVYCVEVFETGGCSSVICEFIQINNIPDAPILTSSCGENVCVGEPCTLTGLSVPPDSVIWTATGNDPGLPGTLNQNEIIITPGQNGFNNYTYTIYENGCENSTSISVISTSAANVDPDNIPVELNTAIGFSVIDNDTIPGSLPGLFSINVTSDVSNGFLVNNGDGTFSYTPNNGFIGDDQFIYEICLDCDGQEVCVWAIVTLSIETEECIIPSVITPNDDGFNDTWEISCIKDNPENEVIILNRWGDEVYRAAPYNNEWRGTYNNDDLPDGTYFYIFKTSANDPDPKKGTINVFR